MTNKELEKEICKKVMEIREMYLKAYPQGDSLDITIFKDCFWFNNRYYGEDDDYPINFYKDLSKELGL